MKQIEVDVLVIGAGPAGSMAAKEAIKVIFHYDFED